jgi:hypothetical protein
MGTPPHMPPQGGDFTQPPNQPPNQQWNAQPLPPGKKGGGMWLWVLGGCLGIVLLGGIAILGLGYLGLKTVQEKAGVTSEEIGRRPVYTAARLLTALNSEIELVDADEATKRVTIREKSTGKTMSITLDELKDGRIRFTDSEGEEFEMQVQGDGNTGSVQIRGSDGRKVMSVGSSNNDELPSWVPRPEGDYTSRAYVSGEGNSTYSGRLNTSLSAEEFVSWFEGATQASGLTMKARTISQRDGRSTVWLQADGENGKKMLSAMGSENPNGGCTILYSAVEKQ